MSGNEKRRKWIISLGFSEAEADSFIEFEVTNKKIEALAEVLHKPEAGVEPETPAPPTPKTKPEVIPVGMFWCTNCPGLHRIASKTGARHLKYREEG